MKKTSARQLFDERLSTAYRTLKEISALELLDGRLKAYGVEHIAPEDPTDKDRCLTDGHNDVWAYINDEGLISSITRYFAENDPNKILGAIAQAFDTDIVSEYDPKFWGFDTKEDWDAANAQMAKEAKDGFHAELVKYLQEPEQPNSSRSIIPQYEIVKRLVKKDPMLLLPSNSDKFLKEVEATILRDYKVNVTEEGSGLLAVEQVWRTGLKRRSPL
jgi:hypothetical protein